MTSLDPLTIVRRRLAAQRLTGEPCADVAAAVAWSGVVQAQEHAEALWSLAMRVGGVTSDDVQAACDRGEVLRTHVLRPTWHFVAAADLRWMLRLTGERLQAKGAGRYRELGLDADTFARMHEVFAATLSDGEPRTRKELNAALVAAGVDTTGQRMPHMLGHAELEGLIVSGPRRGKQHTYLLLEGRVPEAPARSREADVAELALRYFVSHGPATLRDFAWWSGLTIADGKAGVAAAGERLSVAGGRRGPGLDRGRRRPRRPAAVAGRPPARDVRRDARRLPRPALRARRRARERRVPDALDRHRRRDGGDLEARARRAARSSSRRRSRPG